jgi:hypothetical protein
MSSYVEQAKHINTRACPRDFAEAYFRNLSAWEDEAQAIRDHPYFPADDEAFAEGFLRGLAGDTSGGAVERSEELKAWIADVKAKDADVHKSWEEVQAVAVRYGD